ncbi:MAG TPA: ATP-binding protein [Thermoanaerobaculia bacterium]|nr:ATP-binding protein [Thermoanaerobaculia bacterium]
MAGRAFLDYDPATTPLKEMPLIVGITGPSFSGKSYSAGEIATGIQRVYGGQIYWVDTENDRALELHARRGGPFTFRHVPFPQPQSPGEYEAVLDFCLKKEDCGVIIFDTMTHEHIALLNMMEDYMERKGVGDDWEKRDRLIWASQVVPKGQRKRLNERIAFGAHRPDGRKVPIILLYRAQDKTKPGKSKKEGGDGKPVHKGWQAETTSDLPYYMTARFLLPPGSDGHPNLSPDTEWERLAIKNPQQFRGWFKPGFQLNRDIGEKLARWAMGTEGTASASPLPAPSSDPNTADLKAQIKVLLVEGCPGPPSDKNVQAQKAEALEAATGIPRMSLSKMWAEVEKIPADQLVFGLKNLNDHFARLAELRRLAERREEE